jgi:hypothetical protein
MRMSKVRDLVCGPAMVVEGVLRRITPLSAGIGAVRVLTARLLMPGLLAIERFVITHEEAAMRRARNLF